MENLSFKYYEFNSFTSARCTQFPQFLALREQRRDSSLYFSIAKLHKQKTKWI